MRRATILRSILAFALGLGCGVVVQMARADGAAGQTPAVELVPLIGHPIVLATAMPFAGVELRARTVSIESSAAGTISGSRATRAPRPRRAARRARSVARTPRMRAQAQSTALTPSREPAAPIVFHGALLVDSGPSGARVTIDGRAAGTTPVQLAGVAIGTRIIRVEMDGHTPWSSAVRVVANEQTIVAARLAPVAR